MKIREKQQRILNSLYCSVVLLFYCSMSIASSKVVTIRSQSPLIEISVMVRAGSVQDPKGKEGLAYLTARSLIQGGFGDPKDPVTKEKLALMTRPWGERATPSVLVEKESTTFYLTVPEEVLDDHLNRVFQPLFTRPLFQQEDLDRLRKEAVEQVSGSLRYEDIEGLGLNATDHYIFDGTPYAHLPQGSIQGLKEITREDVVSFFVTYYRPNQLIIGISKQTPELQKKIVQALAGIGQGMEAEALKATSQFGPERFEGRHLIIVALPNADSTGIHAAFPISVTRKAPDYWPLYVANVFFGTHRDSFSYLFREIRQKRGYNYGNYSYIEHFLDRPSFLFPPLNTPRKHQYFSIWIRPVAHEYSHHLLKALTWELENFVRQRLTEEQVAAAKKKARVLYLNLAETVSRLLGARLDDAYYGMAEDGYLDHYLRKIDGVTTEQVNSAIRTHLQAGSIKYLVVTDDEYAPKLAEELVSGRGGRGKSLDEYQIATLEEKGQKVYAVSSDKLELIQKDAVWRAYPLEIPRGQIRVVPVERIFETGDFIGPSRNE